MVPGERKVNSTKFLIHAYALMIIGKIEYIRLHEGWAMAFTIMGTLAFIAYITAEFTKE